MYFFDKNMYFFEREVRRKNAGFTLEWRGKYGY